MNFKLPIELIILATLVVGWIIFMLSIHYRYKKRMKEIEKEWEDGRIRQERRNRRWQLDSLCNDRIRRREEISGNLDCVVRWGGEWVPIDEVRSKTDKLSPQKKMGKHTMR